MSDTCQSMHVKFGSENWVTLIDGKEQQIECSLNATITQNGIEYIVENEGATEYFTDYKEAIGYYIKLAFKKINNGADFAIEK